MSGRRDPCMFKYGQPLFAAAWSGGDIILVAGGGGKAGSGIENRVVAAEFKNGQLGDEIASVHLHEACENMVVCPRSALLLTATNKGIVPYQMVLDGSQLSFLAPQADTFKALQPFASEHVTVLATSTSGSMVAIGLATGALHILRVQSFQSVLEHRFSALDEAPVSSEVKSVSFAEIAEAAWDVAATFEDGECRVLSLEDTDGSSRLVSHAQLQKPPKAAQAMIRSCRFAMAANGSTVLICSLNYRGTGFVARWQRSGPGQYTCTSQLQKIPSSITALDVSPDGRFVAVGTSEGPVYLLDSETLNILLHNKKAHMVFCTAVSFARDGHAFVSVSGDASARVTLIPEGGWGLWDVCRCGFVLALLLVLIAVVCLVGGALMGSDEVAPLFEDDPSKQEGQELIEVVEALDKPEGDVKEL